MDTTSDTVSVVQPRAGLGRIGAKLAAGERVTIAWLGGSITWGGNASDREQYSFRARVTAHLRERYPDSELVSINAGIGGTGSDLAAHRLGRDVLEHGPDLVFVEFAVNDGGGDEATVLAAMEGLTRQTLASATSPVLCYLYTLGREHLEAYRAGEPPRTVARHERVAAHYGLPSVNLGAAVARRLLADEVAWDTFSADSCHPTDAGHAMFADVLNDALGELFAAAPTEAETPEALPAPLTPKPWERATMLPAPRDAEGWRWEQRPDTGGWDCFPGLLIAEAPGTALTVPFEGEAVGLFYEIGPTSGDVEVRVDDGAWQTVRLFDHFAAGFWRPSSKLLFDALPPGEHTLHVRIAPTRDERSQGHELRLGYVLVR